MPSSYVEPTREIPVYGQFDVVVVGGGTAGWSAAVAAARNGVKTLVIERFPFFGGTATASLMANIVGIRNQVPPDGIQTMKGIGEELILRLIEIGGAVKSRNAYPSAEHANVKGDLSYNYAFDTEKFKFVTLKMATEAGVHILFHTYFSDVIVNDGRVAGVIIENKSGRQAVFAHTVIDASGDGDVAFRAGVPYWQVKGDEAPRLNDCLMYKVTGFSADTTQGGCLFGDSMVLWGPSPGPVNGADADELTAAEIQTRLAVYEDLERKKRDNPDFGNPRVADTGVLLGIRQTRFFEGDYKITGDDVLSGRVFEDAVAMAVNPVIHYYGYRRFLTHEGYDIPYRCLLPKQAEHLLVVGRCMSSDQIAYESWRAMAHILPLGEAAGTAGALAAKTKTSVRALDVKLLQQTLVAQGAEIGQSRTVRPL